MTQRLFWDDAYLREFTARVARRTPKGIVLDRTAFYPTSGGQPNDTGTINGVRVVDVVEEGEEIVHVLDGDLKGDEVKGSIDWSRRLDHMQQHDGQHILSEAFVRIAKAETGSFHLGAETCTIDLGRSVTPADLEAAEELANRVIWENRPIDIGFFTKDEVAKLPVRKPPAVEGKIRIVHVRDFDCSACCGTHAKASGETGVVLVLGAEKTKSETRISFVCGWRALKVARESNTLLKSAGAKLSSGRTDLIAAVDRVMAQAGDAHKALQAAEKQLAGYRANELVAAAKSRVIVESVEGRDMKYLQAVATAIIAHPGKVAILGSKGATSNIVLARSQDVALDLRPIAKDAFAVIGGKGGGHPHFVQGGGAGQDLAAALKLAEERIVAGLP